MQQNILRVPQILGVCARSYAQHNKKFIYKNQEQVYEKIRYYPRYSTKTIFHTHGLTISSISLKYRDPDFVDTPINDPVKLFKVQRIKPIKGTPYWERKILKLIGVSEKVYCGFWA